MIIILFAVIVYYLIQAIRNYKPKTKAIAAARQPPESKCLLAIKQLQQARTTQQQLIYYLSECITTSENPNETAALLNRKSTAQEKLARIEQKIDKLLTGG